MDSYWSRRNEYMDSLSMRIVDDMRKSMWERYRYIMSSIEKEIDAFVGRYAKDSNITIREAKMNLDKVELDDFRKNLRKYENLVENIDADDATRKRIDSYVSRLKKLSTRVNISRLRALETSFEQYAMEMGVEQESLFQDNIHDSMKEGYAYTSYDLDVEIGFSNGLTPIQMDKLMKMEWNGGTFSSRIWKDKDNLLNHLHTTLLRGIALGHNPRRIANDLKKSMGVSYRACERLARTEVLHFLNEAAYEAYREHGVEKYRFVVSLDERTCEICGALDGMIFNLDEREEGVNYPVMHPNCVLGENIVFSPDARCLTRSEYSGDVFEFITSNGTRFTVTPNHIMLTSRGWVRAKNLLKGDKIIRYLGWKEIGIVGNPTNDHCIPSIENLFTSFSESVDVMRSTMPASSEDFKGDVIENSEIDVVFVNSLLRDEINSSFGKFLGDFAFIPTGESREGFFKSDGFLAKLLVGYSLTSDRILSSDAVSSILLRSSLGHHELVSFRLTSDYDTRLIESAKDCTSGNVESFGKFIDADSTIIERNNLINRKLSSCIGISDCDIVVHKDFSDGVCTTVKDISKLTDALSSFVEFNEIVDVNIKSFHGHVYDVSSDSTLYICNGYLSSNCRCSTIAYFPEHEGIVKSTRFARDNEGKAIEVPEDMTYKEWKEKFVK